MVATVTPLHAPHQDQELQRLRTLFQQQRQAFRQHPMPTLAERLADLKRLKPSTSKGIYVKRVSISTTMGPGLVIDQASLDA